MKNTLLSWLAAMLFALVATCSTADVVSMAFGEKIPPFCFPESNTGIELEVIGEALAFRGHVLKPKYFPFARIPVAFKAKQVDAAMSDLGQDLTADGGNYGDPAVIYDNIFITLKSRNIEIRRPVDLNGLSIISFQGAINRYPERLGPAKAAGNYHEQNDQALQVLTLNEGRYDVVLSDRNIFKYFTLKLKKERDFEPKATLEHKFVTLNPLDYRPIFRNKKIRDDFNAGLKHVKDSGRYQAIYDKYLKE